MISKIFAFILSLFVISIALFYTIKPHKYVAIDSEDLKQLCADGHIATRTINLPEFPKAYNPGFIAYKEGYLLSFRTDSYDGKSWIQHLLNHRASYLGIAKLDKNFHVIGTPRIISHENIYAPQDARLICVDGKIYMLYNDYGRIEKKTQEMFLAELVERDGQFLLTGEPKLLHYGLSKQRIEKNWSPFVFDDKLLVVYRISPHTILEVNTVTGECTKFDEIASHLSWPFGENRGGTPCCLLGDEYISIYHSSKKGLPTFFRRNAGRVFFMGAYTFKNSPPFSVTKMSSQPIGREDDYEVDNFEKIVYPAGLVTENNFIHISWGKNDRMICISTFDKDKLLSTLTPCD